MAARFGTYKSVQFIKGKLIANSTTYVQIYTLDEVKVGESLSSWS